MFNLQHSTKIYLAGAVLGLLSSLLLYAIQPVRWEAQALVLVRMAQVSYEVETIDAIPIVMERFKSPSFRLAVTKRTKMDGVADIVNEDKCNCLSIKPIKNSGALIISVVGRTPELAKATADAVVDELKFKHSEMFGYYNDRVEYKILNLEREIESLSAGISLLTVSMKTNQNKAAQTEDVSKVVLIMNMQADLERRKVQAAELRDSISGFNSRGTQLLEPVFVKDKRLFSSLWRVCLFGALLGAFFSVLWVRWKR